METFETLPESGEPYTPTRAQRRLVARRRLARRRRRARAAARPQTSGTIPSPVRLRCKTEVDARILAARLRGETNTPARADRLHVVFSGGNPVFARFVASWAQQAGHVSAEDAARFQLAEIDRFGEAPAVDGGVS